MGCPVARALGSPSTDRLLADIDAYARWLEESRAHLLPPERISLTTGVASERVQSLLDGAPLTEEGPEKGAEQDRFRRELLFPRANSLRDTRLDPGTGKKYTYAAISERTGLNKQNVWNVFKGRRTPRHTTVCKLETFFGAPLGFCYRTEGEALAVHLRRLVGVELPQLATRVALDRLTSDGLFLRGRGEIDVLRDVLPVLDTLAMQERRRRQEHWVAR